MTWKRKLVYRLVQFRKDERNSEKFGLGRRMSNS